MNFNEELTKKTEEVNQVILRYLPKESPYLGPLIEAMNYSVLAGGKRLRPLIMQETYRMFGGNGKVVEPFMAAMELIHTHSLVHDDLPAIDNDEFRRGKKTTHAQFGEAMGILSGDALLNTAYEVAFTAFQIEPDLRTIPQALALLAGKSGIGGMLGGQSVDVINDGKPLSEETLLFIYCRKTSALLEASLMIGAALAGADESSQDLLEQLGSKVGLAFQIRDDILDVEGNEEELGKPLHSDEKNHKVTYVTLHGLARAKETVSQYSEEAQDLLGRLPVCDAFLEELIRYLIHRTH